MDYQLIQGDCLDVLKTIEGGSIQTCVTSPPYYNLRDYGHTGQLGLEDSPALYIANLLKVFREVKRVLREDGTLWLNLGDSLLPNKCEALIPHRVVIALIEDGWICRSTIIWSKPNPMPESVTDRPTKAHEYIFLLTKSANYYYDSVAIREESVDPQGSAKRYKSAFFVGEKHESGGYSANGATHTAGMKEFNGTRNRRSVWTVTTKPYSGAHFATFPPDLIEPCILAGSREGDLILDPFNGSGTTGEVSLRHRRRYIGIDLNPDYLELSYQRFKKLQPSLLGLE